MDYIIYKGGLDDREIFAEPTEYELWEKIMAEYLIPYQNDENSPFKGLRPYRVAHKKAMNLYGQVDLLAYCLMPSFLYLLIREHTEGALTALLRRVTTYYSMVYNQKRKRKGFVFEGAFKKRLIGSENTLLELTKLVHLTPMTKSVRRFGLVETSTGYRAWEYPYSSLSDYLSGKPRPWIKVIAKNSEDYRNYILDEKVKSSDEAEKLMQR